MLLEQTQYRQKHSYKQTNPYSKVRICSSSFASIWQQQQPKAMWTLFAITLQSIYGH